jgi:hypothetical protein
MKGARLRICAPAAVAGFALVLTVASISRAKGGPILAPDKGTFRITLNGQAAGKENFEISSNGGDFLARSNSEVQTPGGNEQVSGTLQIHADGTPARYEWSAQGQKKAGAVITFNGAAALIELRSDGKQPYTQQFSFASPQIVVLDNNLYSQYEVLAGLYDRDKGGAQTFSVLVPQELTPGMVTVESLGQQDWNGKKLEELRVNSEDLEIDLFLDGKKLMRLVAPSSNAEVIRQ